MHIIFPRITHPIDAPNNPLINTPIDKPYQLTTLSTYSYSPLTASPSLPLSPPSPLSAPLPISLLRFPPQSAPSSPPLWSPNTALGPTSPPQESPQVVTHTHTQTHSHTHTHTFTHTHTHTTTPCTQWHNMYPLTEDILPLP